MPDEEGYWLPDVDALLYRCEMIRQHGDAYRLVPRLHLFIYRGDEALIEILDGLELQIQVTVVTGLVAGLHMNEYEIIMLQCLDGCLSLSFVVGVGQSCGTRNLNNLQSCIVADTADEIYGRDNCATLDLRILLHQRFHGGTIASAPGPDAVCLALAFLGSCEVEGVLGQQVLRFQDHLVDEVGSLLWSHSINSCVYRTGFGLNEEWAPFFVWMVVGWGTDDMLVAAFDDQQMTILDACDELHTLTALSFVDGLG